MDNDHLRALVDECAGDLGRADSRIEELSLALACAVDALVDAHEGRAGDLAPQIEEARAVLRSEAYSAEGPSTETPGGDVGG